MEAVGETPGRSAANGSMRVSRSTSNMVCIIISVAARTCSGSGMSSASGASTMLSLAISLCSMNAPS
jgi:hypothetical protein